MIAVIAAMDKELTSLLEAIAVSEITTVAEKTFYEGTIGGTPVVVAKSGIGKVNAAVTAAILLDRFPVEALINTGLAGGVSPSKTGDIVVSSGLAYSDVDFSPVNPELPYGQMEGEPLVIPADPILLARAEASLRKASVPYRIGTIVSGDRFVTSLSELEAIRKHVTGVIACEMEGMAVAQTARHFGVPCIIVRGISDVLEAPGQVQDYYAVASAIADKTTRFLLGFLRGNA